MTISSPINIMCFVEKGNIQTWSTGEVTSMGTLFYEKYGFNEDISLWDTSRVTDMDASKLVDWRGGGGLVR